ncbi:hypothetical protein V6S67_08225 [Arthrobacter sp. Soc17.1.1.1]|uniref:hypothetical protein n=1 Tax=Arthrobacter sp. Soc17.1.1.1 TaxID=3121277 RepID=UPI002FE4D78D
MENHPDHEYQRIHLLRAIRAAQIDPGELWLHYFGLAGDAGEYEVEAYLHGSFTLPPLQRDLLAHAANELIDRLPAPPRAPYSTDLVPGAGNGTGEGDGGAVSDDGDAAPGARWAPDPAGPTDRPLDWLLDTSAADARIDGTPPGSSHQDGADQDGADQDGASTDGPRPDGAEPDDAS